MKPIITLDAPSASAFAMWPIDEIPPSAITGFVARGYGRGHAELLLVVLGRVGIVAVLEQIAPRDERDQSPFAVDERELAFLGLAEDPVRLDERDAGRSRRHVARHDLAQ